MAIFMSTVSEKTCKLMKVCSKARHADQPCTLNSLLMLAFYVRPFSNCPRLSRPHTPKTRGLCLRPPIQFPHLSIVNSHQVKFIQ